MRLQVVFQTLKALDVKMEVEPESEHTLGHILSVEGENIEESELGEKFMMEASGNEDDTNTRQSRDQYNFDVSVAITEIQSDEIETEFADAVQEIDGENAFPCSQCEKVRKSKGGLTRHTRSKHPDGDIQDKSCAALTKEALASIVESVKAKLITEKIYRTEITDRLTCVSHTDALLQALQPIYTKFCKSNNKPR